MSNLAPSLNLIPKERVGDTWELAGGYISKAVNGTELTSATLRKWAIDGKAQLWFAWSDRCEAAAITQLIIVPSGVWCIILALGGKDMDNWLCLLDELEGWARESGAKQMRIYGRKGWARKLTDYKVTRFVLDKEL